MNNENKGQASIETITILGFIIMFSIPLLMLLTSINSDEASIKQSETSVQILSDTMNRVYLQGEGAQKVVLVAYPENLKNITVENDPAGEGLSELVFAVNTDYGPVDIIGMSFAPVDENSDLLAGTLGAGLQRVKVYYGTDEVVLEAIE